MARFYKEAATSNWVVNEYTQVPAGTCVLIESGSNYVTIQSIEHGTTLLQRVLVTEVQRENLTTYPDIATLKSENQDFFVKAGGTGTVDKTNLADGVVPYASGGNFVPSTTIQQPNGAWLFGSDIEVPGGSISVGEVIKISEGAGDLIITDFIRNTNAFSINSVFNDTGASSPTYIDYGAVFTNIFQPDFSTIITTNPLNFSLISGVASGFLRLATEFTIKANGPMSNFRARLVDNATGITIRYIPNKLAWDTNTGGLNLITGDNVFDLISTAASSPGQYNLGVNPFVTTFAQQIDVEVKGDTLDLLGNVSSVPYISFEDQDGAAVSVGDIAGPGSSIDSHIAAFDGTTGTALKQVEDVVLRATGATSNPTLTIQNDGGTPELVLSADFDTNLNALVSQSPLVIEAGGLSDDLVLISGPDGDVAIRSGAAAPKVPNLKFQTSAPADVGEITTNAAGTQFIVTTPSTNDILVNSAGGNIELVVNSSTKSIRLFGNTFPDTSPVVNFIQNGTNGAASGLHVGNRNPESNVTAIGGTLYLRADDINSAIYLKKSDTANTGWAGVVTGPSSVIDNHIVTFDSSTNYTIKQSEDVVIRATGATSSPSLIIENSSGVDEFVFISDFNVGDNKIDSASTLRITATAGSLIQQTTNGNIEIQTGTGGNSVLLQSAGTGVISSQNAADDTGHLLRWRQTGTNGGLSDIHVGIRNPEGLVTANGGDLYLRSAGTNSDLYVKQSDASNTDWKSLGTVLLELAAMERNTGFGFKDVVLSQTRTTLDFYGGITANEGTFLTANVPNNRIDINTVENTSSGDLYELNFWLNVSFDPGTIVYIETIVNDGVSDTVLTNLNFQLAGFFGTTLRLNTPMHGVFRGPASLTGTGSVRVTARTSTGTVSFRQYAGSLTIKKIS